MNPMYVQMRIEPKVESSEGTVAEGSVAAAVSLADIVNTGWWRGGRGAEET